MTSLYRLLQEVRPVRAFFTSYTFSSDWFEAVLLPLLQGLDCERITVMLDAREARASVDNASSRYGGDRYRVIGTTPVGAGAGIFHPKIAYLQCVDEDVLVVGSANLTAHGQGRSFEVIDAVWAADAPQVFDQVADFFTRLPDRLALLQAPDLAVLEALADRAREQAAAFSSASGATTSPAWLVTTLERSAASQLVELAARHVATPQGLTLLSPFHDRDLRASTALASRLGVAQPAYALARTDGSLRAPFAAPQATAQYVEAPNAGRPLHAKWFEVTGAGECLVMIGSVNATWRSLWTSNNIEVALVRHRHAAIAGAWPVAGDAPVHHPCEFPEPLTDGESLLFSASIGRDGTLEVLLSRTCTLASADLTLRCEDQSWSLPACAVTEGRHLRVALASDFVGRLPGAALWLRIAAGDVDGESWVNVERRLARKPSELDLFRTISRIEGDICDDEDMFQLFSAGHALVTGRRLNRAGKPGNVAPAEVESGSGTRISESDWLAGCGHPHRAGLAGTDEAVRLFNAIGRLLDLSEAELAERLAGPVVAEPDDTDPAREREGNRADNKADNSAGNQPGEPPAPSAALRLAQARASLQAAIDSRLESAVPDALAILILPHKLRNNLRSGMPATLADVDLGQCGPNPPIEPVVNSYLNGVLQCLHVLAPAPATITELLPAAIGAACVAALCLERRGVAVDHARLRWALDTFARRLLTCAELEQAVRAEWRSSRLPRMQRFAIDDLLTQARLVAAAPTLLARINQVIEHAGQARAVPGPATASGVAAIGAALARRHHPKWKLYSVIVTDRRLERISCPQCYGPLDAGQARELRSARMTLCRDRCGRPIFLKQGLNADQPFVREAEAFVRDLRAAAPQEGTPCA